MGRPSIYNEDWAASVLEHLSAGRSLRSWCAADPKRPRRETIMRWALKDTEGFRERYREARRMGAECWADELTELSDKAVGGDMAHVQARKLQIDTRKFLLAKLHPETYGDRLQLYGGALGAAIVNVYLPSKGSTENGARTIDGQAVAVELLEDGSEG